MMDGWGWIDREWKDGEWMDGGWMDGWVNEWMEWMDRWMDGGWMGGRIGDGWMHIRTDRQRWI